MWSSSKHSLRNASLFSIALLFSSALPCVAQELEIAVSPSPVGSGARAAGMADAFLAVADDATAASWNPAGLVQLEKPELSIVGSFNAIFEKFGAAFHDEVDSKHNAHNADLNYLSAAYPLPFLVLGRNACVSLNYQRKYDFSRQFGLDYNTYTSTSRGASISNLLHMDFEQNGGLSTISPAFAIGLTHRLSLGVAVNFWRSSFFSENSWEQTIETRTLALVGASAILGNTRTQEEYKDLSAENFTLGLLWNPSQKWNLGLRYDSAFTGEADYRSQGYRMQSNLPTPFFKGFLSVTPVLRRETRHVRFPDSLALGTAYRPNDRLTVSLDLTRTDWNDFYVKDANGNRNSLVDFSDLNNNFTRPRFDPTHTVRLGAEYVFIPKEPEEQLGHLWTLRGGLFYDEEPATGKSDGFTLPGDNGDGDPDPFYGFALGAGLLLGQRINIDAAYQLRHGPGVNEDFIRGVDGFEEDVFQHRFLLSTVIYF